MMMMVMATSSTVHNPQSFDEFLLVVAMNTKHNEWRHGTELKLSALEKGVPLVDARTTDDDGKESCLFSLHMQPAENDNDDNTTTCVPFV